VYPYDIIKQKNDIERMIKEMIIVNKDDKVLVSNGVIRQMENIQDEHIEKGVCRILWNEYDKLIKDCIEVNEAGNYSIYSLETWKKIYEVGGKISSVVFTLYDGNIADMDPAMYEGELDLTKGWPFGGDDDVDYLGSYIDGYLDGTMMVHSTFEDKGDGLGYAYVKDEGDEWVDVPEEFSLLGWMK
jgi:hypothetical protein